jgi:hypothetical protein
VASYVSLNRGRTWSKIVCGALPIAGCSAPSLWSRTSAARYALYRGRLYRSLRGQQWRVFHVTFPVDPRVVTQVVAGPGRGGDLLLMVAPTGIWELKQDGSWKNLAAHLGLGSPLPGEG